MSSKPVLYYAPRSAPCRSVLLTAAAIGLDLSLRLMNLKEGDHLTAEFLKLNPQHTIPVLDDNGVAISDSHVICAYLVEKYSPDDTLYPKELLKRMQVDARLFYDCGHLFPRVRLMLEPVIYFGCDEIDEDKITYMQNAYDGVEKCLANSLYLCGESLTIADLCSIASVSSALVFAPVDEKKFPKLCSWLERMQQLPYYQKQNQVGVEMLEKVVKEKLIENKRLKGATPVSV